MSLPLSGALLALLTMHVSATVRYVDVNSTNATPPYTNWGRAAVTIQDAVNVAAAGDQILVTNGVYETGGEVVHGAMTNRVAVTKSLTVQSVNGPGVTEIRGYQVPGPIVGDGAVRCVYLTDGAVLIGFTLANGATRSAGDSNFERSGGGVWCESSSGVVSNCVVVGNSAALYGGGVAYATLNNCTVISNSAANGGGACSNSLNGCTLNYNWTTAAHPLGHGGGAYFGTLNDCSLTGNGATYGGGTSWSTLKRCKLMENSATQGGGANGCELNNCLLVDNEALLGGGAAYGVLDNCTLAGNYAIENDGNDGNGGGAFYGVLKNCTLTGNWASTSGSGAYFANLTNCIVYFNYDADYAGGTLAYCCTTPHPGGTSNFTDEPLFINQIGRNLRLQTNSPCIDAGSNSYVTNTTDLDGRSRILGGAVDVGAYEYQGPGMGEFIPWLQQYALPTDGSVDTADSDNDRMNNWQEWRCRTDPTNALSVLRLLAPLVDEWGVTVSWESVIGRTYFLERTTNFQTQPAFLLLATNISAWSGTTTYGDTNAIGNEQFYYRVGVEE